MVLGRQIQLSQPVQKEGRDNLAPALIHFTRGYYYYLSRSFALSRAPSPLSWLLLFPLPTCFSLLRSSRANYILLIRDSARKVTSRARGRVSSIHEPPRRILPETIRKGSRVWCLGLLISGLQQRK